MMGPGSVYFRMDRIIRGLNRRIFRRRRCYVRDGSSISLKIDGLKDFLNRYE